ncbi:MAG: hypothetical protein ABIJ61_05745 [bacterium]
MAKRRQQKAEPTPRPQLQLPENLLAYVLIVVAVAIFIYLCNRYMLTQDDAYISFRYAANWLAGDGLVYNAGEHVEGFTNFLWVILLALFKGVFGVGFLTSSKFLGIFAGVTVFPLIYLLLKWHEEKPVALLYLGIAIALLTNLSFAYWSTASLETVAFTAMIFAALVCEYRKPELTPGLLVIATLLRPEGGLVFAVVLIDRLLWERRFPFQYFLIYVAFLLPFAAFKLSYYGSLFPNPYYAKSGVGLEYIQSGLEYLWFFSKTLGVLFGFVFLPPILMIRKLWRQYSLLYLFLVFYIAYIVWVGGDVLKVYRFFVPVVPVLYFLFVVASRELYGMIMRNRKHAAYLTALVTLVFSLTALLLSKTHVDTYFFNEHGITDKMAFLGRKLIKHMGPDFSIAASTIGILGYELMGHRVIDMLGLTDSYIARNPEQVQGIESTWKERRFNNVYLLSQEPDFVLFSTGYKPSAPAERALMLHSQFRRNYRPTGFMKIEGQSRQYKIAWQRHGEIDLAADTVHADLEFVDKLNAGYNELVRGNYLEAIPDFMASWDNLGEEYALLMHSIGECYQQLKQEDSAQVYFEKAIELDPGCWEARIRILTAAQQNGQSDLANEHYRLITDASPWVFDYEED